VQEEDYMIKNIQIPERRTAENSSQYVYRVLRQNIMDLTLYPGEIINENSLCQLLGVSRTPIREALFRLREERLITVYSQSKSFVSLIDYKLCHEGQFIRETIGSAVYAKLCGKSMGNYQVELEANLQLQKFYAIQQGTYLEFFDLDNEFHRLLYTAAGCEMTWDLVQKACTHYDRIRFMFDQHGQNHLKTVYEEHQQILDSILANDKERVRASVHRHIMHYSIDNRKNFTQSSFSAELMIKFKDAFCNVPQDILDNEESKK